MPATTTSPGCSSHNAGSTTPARTTTALAGTRETQDKGATAAALNNLASVLYVQGDPDGAAPFDREALSIRREIGAPGPIAVSLANIAETTFDRAQLQSAAAMYEESLTLFEKINDRSNTAYMSFMDWGQ